MKTRGRVDELDEVRRKAYWVELSSAAGSPIGRRDPVLNFFFTGWNGRGDAQ